MSSFPVCSHRVATESTSGNVHDFLSVVKELEPAGELKESKSYPFTFENVERQHESYYGINISLNYFLKVTIYRNLNTNLTKQTELWVRCFGKEPEANSSIKMEVIHGNCALHQHCRSVLKIAFTLNSSTTNPSKNLWFYTDLWKVSHERRHHRENIFSAGSIEDQKHEHFPHQKGNYRFRLAATALSLTNGGLDMYNENRTLSKYEVMDGAPVRGHL